MHGKLRNGFTSGFYNTRIGYCVYLEIEKRGRKGGRERERGGEGKRERERERERENNFHVHILYITFLFIISDSLGFFNTYIVRSFY